jgi:secondary thiamine-phosphate synthase enzyme
LKPPPGVFLLKTNKEAVYIWHEIMITTKTREQFLNITTLIAAELERARMKDGVCYIYIPHTTAGVTINENADPDVTRDMLKSLARLIPETGDYAHAEGNSDAHLKASMMGFSCMIPVSGGQLCLGIWQGVYFCEFDGPRKRKFMVGFHREPK